MLNSRLSQYILVPRLTHMVIGMASLMLILRLGAMAETAAKDPDPKDAPKKEDKKEEKKEEKPEEKKEAAQEAKKEAAAETKKAADAEAKKEEPPKAPEPEKVKAEPTKAQPEMDPLLMDEAQVKVLMSLADRRKQIDKEEAEMKKRQALIALSEKKVNAQLEKLQEVKAYIEKNKPAGMVSPEENVKRMVKVYEGMKPAAAAKIFDKMDLETLIQVVQGMKQKNVGAIMALMDTARAREITTKMITLQIPLPQPATKGEKKPG